tara:strand:- start:369 stop:542 length:174 start_codon:yes stop_codon:yes gene_type:complete
LVGLITIIAGFKPFLASAQIGALHAITAACANAGVGAGVGVDTITIIAGLKASLPGL